LVQKLYSLAQPGQALKTGDHQIIIISPELLLSKRFVDEMLRDRKFTTRILSIIVDEAHVVSHWGAGFRKKYGELGVVRAFIPHGTPIVAMSATMPTRVRQDVLRKLEFAQDGYIDINVGNERPNVALVVRAIEHAMNTYADLSFVIPKTIQKPEDVPSTMIYADNVPNSVDLEDALEALLPQRFRYQGLIRPFNAAFCNGYRETVLKQFKLGTIRVLVCTDAAGMVSIVLHRGCVTH
jgi:superfamily II DNA helicase RecQ